MGRNSCETITTCRRQIQWADAMGMLTHVTSCSCDKLQEADARAQAADASRLRDVMSRCGALGSERPRASFKTSNLEQDLTRLLKSGNVEQHRDVLERTLASSALAGEPSFAHMVSTWCPHGVHMGVHMVSTWYALLQQKASTYTNGDGCVPQSCVATIQQCCTCQDILRSRSHYQHRMCICMIA